jgi:hypothetical protein
MKLTLKALFGFLILVLTIAYFYGLHTYLSVSMLSNEVELELSQLQEFRDVLVLENNTIKAEIASKVMENEKMQQLLLDLAQKSDDSLFIKITVILTFFAVVGLVLYVQSLGVPASEEVVAATTFNSIGLVSTAQSASAECILALETQIQSSNYCICTLVTRLNENTELISSLNSRIDGLTLSATKLEASYKLLKLAFTLSGGN